MSYFAIYFISYSFIIITCLSQGMFFILYGITKFHFCCFSSFEQIFEFFLKISIPSDFADCLEFNDIFLYFCFKHILNERIFALLIRKTVISHPNTCKLTKLYISSLIFQKQLNIFESKLHPQIQ